MKKMSDGPYAHIDWKKASQLFQKPFVGEKKNRFIPATKEILHILAAAGTIGFAFISPRGANAISELLVGDRPYSRWGTKKIIAQLEKQKYVSIKENSDGNTTVYITKKGLRRALSYNLDSMHISKPKQWDGKWRVVIFDVPERHHRLRDAFRHRLRQLNLYLLQESVYVFPYPCFDEVEFLRELFDVSFSVRYLLVEKIEEDAALRRYYDLA